MSHFSPSTFLLWAILTIALGIFYVNHLWHFDRFHCLNLRRTTRNGAFARFMTYSYLVAVPLLLTYTVGFAVIKYEEGYISLPSGAVLPRPYELWSPKHQAAYFPLNILWALSWASEAVSHHEELCFWFFLIHSGPSPTPWFKSIYFKIWAGGSVVAVISIPAVAAVTRDNPLRSEACFQLVGATISLMITLWFLPILWIFPRFIQNVKNEGADYEAIMRLARFHDLNIIRIAFRFLFIVPVLMLAIDGLQPHTHVLNETQYWTDLLVMSSSVGCVVQSVITLMIFFPRNVDLETRRWLYESSAKPPRTYLLSKLQKTSKLNYDPPRYLLTDSPAQSNLYLASTRSPYMANPNLPYEEQTPIAWDDPHLMTSLNQPARLTNTDALGLTEANILHATPTLYPMARSYTSPINIDPLDFPPRL